MTVAERAEIAVVGGGLVGSALAFGLARRGRAVAVLDEGDVAYRASRGNFGLVWVQGKGVDCPAYAAWTRRSAELWPALAAELAETTGIDVDLQQPGGIQLCLTKGEMDARARALGRLHNQAGGAWRYEMLDRDGLARLLPDVGPRVVGGSFCPDDGHASPLKLLRALQEGLRRRGGRLLSGARAEAVTPVASGFEIRREDGGTVGADRVVLAAGLGTPGLARGLGLDVPVRPQRGQVLVTERMPPFLSLPTVNCRQTAEGSIMFGDSKEEVGFDEGTRRDVLARIARRAILCFPQLEHARIVRTWGALRVMSPDGLPIYAAVPDHPGAFVATVHSGVTLAGAHALALAPTLDAGAVPEALAPLSHERFADAAAA